MLKAVLFDWGDTVMEELPGMYGPMSEWRKVEATPGIGAVLAGLQGRMHIGIATNAEESDAVMVRLALARVDLAKYFTHIFTARNLECRKPQAEYFGKIAEELGCRLNECLMIGNAQSTDANGAAAAGMHALWLMRSSDALYGHPLLDGVMIDYSQFDARLDAVETGRLPGFNDCLKLLRSVAIKPGLFRHVQKVALAAYALGLWLLENGVEVDPVLAHRAALLHDIDKGLPDRNHLEHGHVGADLVREAGYPALHEAIYRHQVLSILDEATRPQSLEAMLVFLADKLVEKDRIVGVQERIHRLAERNPGIAPELQRCLPLTLDLQTHIAEQAGVNPVNLVDNLSRAIDRVDLDQYKL